MWIDTAVCGIGIEDRGYSECFHVAVNCRVYCPSSSFHLFSPLVATSFLSLSSLSIPFSHSLHLLAFINDTERILLNESSHVAVDNR